MIILTIYGYENYKTIKSKKFEKHIHLRYIHTAVHVCTGIAIQLQLRIKGAKTIGKKISSVTKQFRGRNRLGY